MGRQYGSTTEKGKAALAQRMQEMEMEAVFRKKIERIASIVLVALGIIVLIGCNISAGNFKKKKEETIVQLNQTQTELSELETETDAGAGIVEVEAVSASAEAAGNDVRDCQQDLNAAIADEQRSGMNMLSDTHQALLQRLRARFPESTNSRLIRNTWCTLGNWEFNGVFQFEGSHMTVVWKCYAPSDREKERMLCFVKAMYNAETDTFEKGEIRYTAWYKTLADSNDMLTEGDQVNTNTGDGDVVDNTDQSSPVENSFDGSDTVDYDVENDTFSDIDSD